MESISTTLASALSPAYTFIPSGSNAVKTSLYLSSAPITTTLGLNVLACSINREALLPAVSTSISKKFSFSATTSNAWVPIEPVDPSMAICFFCCSCKRYYFLSGINPSANFLSLDSRGTLFCPPNLPIDFM